MQASGAPLGHEQTTTTMRRPEADTNAGISSIESLREHLQWAIELEHTTIPSYLTALYSLDPVRNAEAAEVIHSVFLEEMLHLALAGNLLNAVGGHPELDHPRLLPAYPRCLPHSDPSLLVSLVPFGHEALDLFLRIEQPCAADAPPQDEGYETIGQFYESIRRGLVGLTADLGEATVFCGAPERQLSDKEFRGGPGRIFEVLDLVTALRALDLIVEQGEGTDHIKVWDGDPNMFHAERDAVGHYYRFRELELGRQYCAGDTPATGPTGELIAVDWDAVHPMRRNPRSAEHDPGSAIRLAMDRFNSTYCTVLNLLEQTFNGRREMLAVAIPTMFDLRADAELLMSLPNEDGVGTAGPSFEYVASESRRTS